MGTNVRYRLLDRRSRCWLRKPFVAIVVVIAGSALVDGQVTDVSVSKAKLTAGESVEITIRSNEEPKAVIFEPTVGSRELELRKVSDGVFRGRFDVSPTSSHGLYAVHAWTGDKQNPASVRKASFRVGNIVADFFIANYLDKEQLANDLDAYLKDFRSVGGNFLIAHNLIVPTGALYPSKITKTATPPDGKGDIVELVLDRADRLGIPVLLSVSWDVTRQTPYKDRMPEIKAIAAELYGMYRHHPSLAGFYSWQEGSGTYYAPFVREFSEHIKGLDQGLLTACAPHIDDPLLASYLSVIDELDMMIYQSAVMASYRPDNRKEYPLRRVRDFSSLGAGAKRLQNKIVLTHVELFAYMEKRLQLDVLTASYNDIYGQILSAATVTDTDGIALFSYHAHIFEQSKRFEAGKTGRSAVAKGLKLFDTITSEITSARNPIALYIPYSDFVIERWNNYFLPALDAFRKLGVPIDILPYAPRADESVYPYYPIHMNEEVLERLLKERTVLVLANVSGFQQTDSDLIKAFVERGGVVVAFGPQIPFGRTFERDELFGGRQLKVGQQTRIAMNGILGRGTFTFAKQPLPSWTARTATVLATYSDGSAAVLNNKFGRGEAFSVLPDASFTAKWLPQLSIEVLNSALDAARSQPLLRLTGTETDMDIASKAAGRVRSIAIVNHGAAVANVVIRDTQTIGRCSIQNGTGPARQIISTRRLEISVPGNEASILMCAPRL